MVFEIDAGELKNAVAIASKAIATKTATPMLYNVLIEAENDKIKIVGTDLEVMQIVEVSADVQKCGKITTPAKLLLELISGLPTDLLFPVRLELINDELQITAGKSSFAIRTLSADDYPPVPNVDGLVEIKGNELAHAIRRGGIAASTEEANPIQKSVLVDFSDTPIVVSTDSKRLAANKITIDAPEGMKEPFIVPIHAVKEIIAILTGADVVKIGKFREQLVFKRDGVTFITRLVDGRFPNWQKVVPKEHTIEAVFYRKELAQAIKSLVPIARNNSNLINLDFANNSIKLWSKSAENGKAESVIDCKLTGEPINIAFNAAFITGFLGAVNCDECRVQMTTPNYPALFESVDDEPLQFIAMPMAY